MTIEGDVISGHSQFIAGRKSTSSINIAGEDPKNVRLGGRGINISDKDSRITINSGTRDFEGLAFAGAAQVGIRIEKGKIVTYVDLKLGETVTAFFTGGRRSTVVEFKKSN